MSGTAFVVLSGSLTFGIPLLLAIHELYDLRRRRKGNWDGDGPGPNAPPSPPNLGKPSLGHKPLPDCLIPQLQPNPARMRELEEV
ncbi:MAG: hypothetical protein EOO66_07545 [Methylobacterium sp.]|nr:MAG: hypothetical protein EOO66_07545 [Methylobacterium sp.]